MCVLLSAMRASRAAAFWSGSLITGLTLILAAAPASPQPGTPQTAGVRILAPFEGRWAAAQPQNIRPPFNDRTSSHPSAHIRPGGGDWATDLYAPAGTPVTLNIVSDIGPVEITRRSTWDSCGVLGGGQGIALRVRSLESGAELGWISFAHLDNLNTAGPYSDGTVLGTVTTESSVPSCFSGRTHAHFEMKSQMSAGKSCYGAFDQPGSSVGPADAIGGLGGFVNSRRTSCGITQTPSDHIRLVSKSAAGRPADAYSHSPAFSPDGRKILFESDAASLGASTRPDPSVDWHLFVKHLSTGRVQQADTNSSGVSANGFTSWPVWSADGSQIAFSSKATNLGGEGAKGDIDVYLKSLSNGNVRRLTSSGGQAFPGPWSPNGTWIPVQAPGPQGVGERLALINPRNGRTVTVWKRNSSPYSVASAFGWSADSNLVALRVQSAGASRAGLHDLSTQRTRFLRGCSGPGARYKWARNGIWMIASRTHGTFRDITVRNCTSERTAARLANTVETAAISPSGTVLAYVKRLKTPDPVGGRWVSLWVRNLRTGNERLLVEGGWLPTWSPDGTKIAFQGRLGRGYEGFDQVFVVDVPKGLQG